MKRCIWLVVIMASVIVSNGAPTWALPLHGLVLASLNSQYLVEIGEEKRERKIERFKTERGGKDGERKGVGARFWGGPYWGYGPRWGHPCQSCQDTCENDGESDSARCKRCRVRCGW